MPSIAQEVQDPICSKKRRREDGEQTQMQMKLSSPRLNTATHFSSRRLINIKTSKRQRLELPFPAHSLHTTSHQEASPFESGRDSYFPPQHTQDRPRGWIVDTTQVKPAGKKDLSPCHICHRRPTVIQELDSFANCEGCGERCCWICVRECAGFSETGRADGFLEDGNGGSGGRFEEVGKELTGGKEAANGHRGMVCSRCCVERGTEGEVWCLGCLRSEGDG